MTLVSFIVIYDMRLAVKNTFIRLGVCVIIDIVFYFPLAKIWAKVGETSTAGTEGARSSVKKTSRRRLWFSD